MATTSAERIALANGETREITKTWADGAHECPWCLYPVRADEPKCGNPQCDTALDLDGLAARRETERKRAEALEREAAMRRYQANSRQQREREEAELWAELSGKAVESGQCIPCLRRSYWRTAPKLVKHRKGTVCPNAAR